VCTPVRLRVATAFPVGSDEVLEAVVWSSQVRWRLLSANNRQLGRGAPTYPDVTAARRAVRLLAARLGDAEPDVHFRDRAAGWVWSLRVGNELAAVSGRGYERSALAGQALELFLVDLPLALRRDG
jgi:hypothetical protein